MNSQEIDDRLGELASLVDNELDEIRDLLVELVTDRVATQAIGARLDKAAQLVDSEIALLTDRLLGEGRSRG